MTDVIYAGVAFFVLLLAMFTSVRIATVAYSTKLNKVDTVTTVLLHLLWVGLLVGDYNSGLSDLYSRAFEDMSWVPTILTNFFVFVMTFAMAVTDGSCVYRRS